MVPSGPPAQVSILQASRSTHSGFLCLLSTAPGTDPVGPWWKQRTGSLFPRFAGTESSDTQKWAPSSWETPAWPLLWKSWHRWNPHTSSDLRGSLGVSLWNAVSWTLTWVSEIPEGLIWGFAINPKTRPKATIIVCLCSLIYLLTPSHRAPLLSQNY